MKMVKYSPVSLLNTPFINDIFDVLPRTENETKTVFKPATDIIETDEHFMVAVSLPGINKEDVTIEIEDDELRLTAERRLELPENAKLHLKEMREGKLERTFELGKTIDRDKIEASFSNGVLSLKLTKKEESVARKIEIA